MTFNSCGICPSCKNHDISYCHEFFPRNFDGVRNDGSSALSKVEKLFRVTSLDNLPLLAMLFVMS
jgi:Zn-dependent alcohol dehydrogenase